MRNLKRMLTLILAMAVCFSITVTAYAAVEDTGFSDVAADAWYADAVQYCRDNGLMSGTSTTTFSPNVTTSRAMLVMVLYRQAGSPAGNSQIHFSDVPAGVWYADAVAWASSNGIAAGYGNNIFGSNDPVTREQLATILWRYAGSPEASDDAAPFADAAQISSFAVGAVAWARAEGIVSGKPSNLFDPQGSATRAEMAVMLYRWLDGNNTPDPDTPSVSPEVDQISSRMIRIPGGTYTMGSPDTERLRDQDETAHQVTVSSFYVDPYEVTQRDYMMVMGENPSHFHGDGLPVDSVSWYDAVEYCNRLSLLAGLTPVYTIQGQDVSWDRSANGYRLLTEAEWEYVARAGTTTEFYTGNFISSDEANYYGIYPYLIEENYVRHTNPDVVVGEYRNTTVAGNTLAPNDFQVYNILGNVSEWVFDYYGAYDLNQTTDPVGDLSGSLRVNRGGSYNDFAKHLRSAYRSATTPTHTDQNLGFRIARNDQMGQGMVDTTYSLDIQIPENPHILIAYFSTSGNTENAARIIQQRTGADLVEIQMAHPYSGSLYEESQRDLYEGRRPELTTYVDNMDEYDVILLGYPTWWATMPMPVVSFLEDYDFSGKTIISFSSHGGGVFGESVSTLAKEVPGAQLGESLGFHYSGGSSLSDNISNWLAQNGIEELN